MLPIRFDKYIIYMIILFIILYIDQRSAVFSQAWKIVLLLVILLDVLRIKMIHYRRPTFLKFAYLWGVKNFINYGLIEYPFATITYGVKYSILPVLCDYFVNKFKSKEAIFKCGLIISQYFIIFNIPFLLGILKPADFSFLIYDGVGAYTGIFTGQHTTAITTVMAMMFLAYQTIIQHNIKIKNRIYNGILLIIACYILYSTFTRTGWAMGVLGMIILISARKSYVKMIITQAIALAVIGLAYTYMLNNDERFYNRINDITNDGRYQSEAGSGRLIFATVSINMFANSEIPEQILGNGIEPLMDNMERAIGMRIYSHNGWIDALTGNGIIGFFLLLGFCSTALIYSIKHRKEKYAEITISCIIMYISYQSTQGGVFFYQDLLVAIALALIIKIPTHNNNTYINENSFNK